MKEKLTDVMDKIIEEKNMEFFSRDRLEHASGIQKCEKYIEELEFYDNKLLRKINKTKNKIKRLESLRRKLFTRLQDKKQIHNRDKSIYKSLYQPFPFKYINPKLIDENIEIARRIWNKSKELMYLKLGKDTYYTWIELMKVIGFSPERHIIFKVKSESSARRVILFCMDIIENALNETLGYKIKVLFTYES